MKQGNITQFESYSQFSDLQQFNNSMEQWWIDIHKNKLLTKSEIIAIKFLVRYACKLPGLANCKISTVTAATFTNGNIGISRSTFKRAIKKAQQIGLLNVHELERKNGSQSSNLYVFNQYKDVSLTKTNELPKVEKLNHHENYPSFKTSNQKDINKRTNDVVNETVIANDTIDDTKQELSAEFVSDRVPSEFSNLASCFWNSAKTIEQLWQRVEICAYNNSYEHDEGVKVDVGLQSLKQAVRGLKLGKVRDFKGYMYGIMKKKFLQRYFEELHAYDGDIVPTVSLEDAFESASIVRLA